MAHLNHLETFPESFPKTPAPYKGAAGNFGKSGPAPEILFSGKAGDFRKRDNDSSLALISIGNQSGDSVAADFSNDETEVL